MNRVAVCLLLCGVAGCSAFLDLGNQQTIRCHATREPIQCAPEDAVPRALEVYARHVAPIEQALPLVVHWYDGDHIFKLRHKEAAGWTDLNARPIAIHVTGTSVMMHEINHVFLAEETGNPDENHEEPGGSWGQAHNTALDKATLEFGVTNATPCPPEVCEVDDAE